jgi:hypothetical protein
MSFNFFGVAAEAEVPDTTRVVIEKATSPTSAFRFNFICPPKSVTIICILLYISLLSNEQ